MRFTNENEAKKAWQKAVEAGSDGKVILDDKELTASFIEGKTVACVQCSLVS